MPGDDLLHRLICYCWERGQGQIHRTHNRMMSDFRLQVGTMDLWDQEQLRKSFDYHEPCIRMWENCRPLRERAIQGKSLVASVYDAVQPTPPSLENMSKNHTLLKGFTTHMADTGVI